MNSTLQFCKGNHEHGALSGDTLHRQNSSLPLHNPFCQGKAKPGPQPIPLYNSEGTVIGTFMCGGYGSEDLGIEGMSIEEAKAAVAAMFDAE